MGGCGFILQYLYLDDSLGNSVALGGEGKGPLIQISKSTFRFMLDESKIILKCAWPWSWFGMVTQVIHYIRVLFFEQITQIPLIFTFHHHLFFSSSNYFDTQLLKSTWGNAEDWLRQPMKTSSGQNNFSLAQFFSYFLKLVLVLYQDYLRVNVSPRISWVCLGGLGCGFFLRKDRGNLSCNLFCVTILHVLHLQLDLLFFVYVRCHGLHYLPVLLMRACTEEHYGGPYALGRQISASSKPSKRQP